MQRILNILSIYHKASGFELEAGLRWYLTAHSEAKRLGDKLHTYDSPGVRTTSRAAAVIEAVSQGLRWERNIEAAERIIIGVPLDGLGV